MMVFDDINGQSLTRWKKCPTISWDNVVNRLIALPLVAHWNCYSFYTQLHCGNITTRLFSKTKPNTVVVLIKALIGRHCDRRKSYSRAFLIFIVFSIFQTKKLRAIQIPSMNGGTFQTSCPTMFFYIPSCVALAIFIGRVDTNPLVTDCIGLLYSWYPLSNSLVTMFSITDYRRCLLSLFGPREGTQVIPI